MKEARRYVTPLAFKTAVEMRLRRAAAASGTDLQRLRQMLVFDRYVARLVCVLDDAVVLKGGFVLELRLERARTTKDIDLRIVGAPDDVLPALQQAGRLDLGDFLTFEVQPDPQHHVIRAEGLPYDGFRFRAGARLAGKIYGNPFGVDVAFAEPLIGAPEVVAGSDFLTFAGVAPAMFRVYPVESHVAEKLHAYTLPRDRPNSRVKDLPDLALLASVGPLAGGRLRAAIDAAFRHRGTHAAPEHLPDPSAGWRPVYERLAKVDGLRWPTLASLVTAVRAFLDPVLGGAEGMWDPGEWEWREADDGA